MIITANARSIWTIQSGRAPFAFAYRRSRFERLLGECSQIGRDARELVVQLLPELPFEVTLLLRILVHSSGNFPRLSVGVMLDDETEDRSDALKLQGGTDRRVRADAQRNIDALLQAALAVFATSGVDAPVREIAEKAGVGIGTLYRHFPQRSDLIAAVFRREIDACASAAQELASEHEPFEALANWMQRYASFIATKRGLATALHSGDPTFDHLPEYFKQRLHPALQKLLESAAAAGKVRTDVAPDDLLNAAASLCMSSHDDGTNRARRMVALLVDGLRYGTSPAAKTHS